MALTRDTLVVRRSDTLYDEADGGIVVMNLDNGAFYGFNAVATDILRCLAEPRRVSEIRDHLLTLYEVDAETCEAQVLALLDQLVAERLVTCCDDTASAGAEVRAAAGDL